MKTHSVGRMANNNGKRQHHRLIVETTFAAIPNTSEVVVATTILQRSENTKCYFKLHLMYIIWCVQYSPLFNIFSTCFFLVSHFFCFLVLHLQNLWYSCCLLFLYFVWQPIFQLCICLWFVLIFVLFFFWIYLFFGFVW